jgi:hypothetical protein
MAAARALDCAEYALLSDGRHLIPLISRRRHAPNRQICPAST